MNRLIILILSSIYIFGCAWVADFPRTMWGSSVRVLSDRRSEAETQTFSCSKEISFEIVKGMTFPYGAVKKDSEDDEEGDGEGDGGDEDGGKFLLFAKDPKMNYLIIMGVPDAVNTTEVGVFFDEVESGQTKVDISSLSSRAKKTVAGIIFTKLSESCQGIL